MRSFPKSELLKKSEENRKAALKLWSVEKWFAPSVHCAYYSCVQLMIHIIMTVGGKKYETMESEIGSFRGGSHGYYIQQVQSLLVNSGKANKIKDFSQIKTLKTYRETSDYKPVEVTYDDSDKANSLAEKISKLLKAEFAI